MLILIFIRNRVTLHVTNITPEIVIFDPGEMIGILDLRSLGYYKIKQGVLQQNLSKDYYFGSVDATSDYYNKFVNALKSKRKKQKKNTHG